MTDNILVSRDNQLYQVDMTSGNLKDTDLVLVSREVNGTPTLFKVTGDKISGGGGDLSSVTLAPLTGTPNFEITAVTDISAIPEGATATYTWYRYDGSTGDAGRTQLQQTALTTTSDTYDAVATDQGKYIGCTVTYLGKTENETTRVEVGQASVPIARMNGLRFDTDRATTLTRTPTVAGNRKTWTWSAWMKPTKPGSNFNYLLDAVTTNPGSGENAIRYSNGKINWYSNSTGEAIETVSTFTNIEWLHVVVNYDSTQATESNRIKIYVNGNQQTLSGTYPSLNAEPHINDTNVHNVGSSGAYGRNFDGYLSDCYLIDGYVIPPTAFGKEFLLGWGPLDYTEVIENVGYALESPYDTRPNMDKNWTSLATGSAITGTTLANAFDGNLSNYVRPNNGQTIVWDNIGVEGTIEIFGYKGSNTVNEAGGTAYIKINDNDVTTQMTNGVWSPISGTSALNKIEIKSVADNDYTGFNAIRVNGRILVDGPADNSQNWSDTSSGLVINNGTISGMFNGSLDGNAAENLGLDAGSNQKFFSVNNDLPVTASSSVVVYMNAGTRNFEINDTPVNGTFTLINGANGVGSWDLSLPAGATSIDSISVSTTGPSTVWGVSIDGKILVDSPEQWDTSEIWSGNTTISGTGWTRPENVGLMFAGTPNTGSDVLAVPYINSGTHTGILEFTDLPTGTTWEVNFGYGTGLPAGSGYKINDGPLIPVADLNNKTFTTLTATQLNNQNTITKIEVIRQVGGSGGIDAPSGLRVDGKLLVDAGSFGNNGFYLPFDPAQTGENWSSSGDISEWSNVFDGNTNNGIANTVGDKKPATWNIGSGNAIPGPVQIYLNNGTGTGWLTINGNAIDLDASGPNQSQWLSVPGVSELYSIALSQGNEWGSISAVKVNGKILVDHSSIGVDASGQNNNLHDKNFTVSNDNAPSASEGFRPVTYTGNGGSQTLTCGFKPDFVWTKSRNLNANNEIYDIVRGPTNVMFSNLTDGNDVVSDGVTAFTNTGFTLGGRNGTNGSGTDYVAWCWKAGGSPSANTDGTLTAQVSANVDYGFSIVKYTGNGGIAQVGHGLDSIPKMIWVKSVEESGAWYVYHNSLGFNSALLLNSDTDEFAPTPPGIAGATDEVFSLGGGRGQTNAANKDYIAYCWSEVPGFSKIGSYEGSTGNQIQVECGFRPAYLMYKCATAASTNWHVFDNQRNNAGSRLIPNLSETDSNGDTYSPTFTDTGFVVSDAQESHTNTTGNTYIFIAFAQFVTPDNVKDTPMNNYNVLAAGFNGNLEIPGENDVTGSTITISEQTGPNSFYWESYGLLSGISGVMALAKSKTEFGTLDSITYRVEGSGTDSALSTFTDGSISGTTIPGDVMRAGDICAMAVSYESNNVAIYRNGKHVIDVSLDGNTNLLPRCSGSPNVVGVNFGQQPFRASNVTYDQETSTVTLANLAANMEEVWGNGSNISGDSNTTSHPAANAFNGVLGTENVSGAIWFANYASDAKATWTSPVTFDNLTSLRLFTDKSGSGAGYLRVNGNDYDSYVTDGWITIPETSLTTIEIGYTGGTSTATGLGAVEVNGRLLIDGPGNTSQVWSGLIRNPRPADPAQNAFDGNAATAAVTSDSNPNAIYWDGSLTGVSTFEIQIRESGISDYNTGFTVSGTGLTSTNIQGPSNIRSFQSIPVTSTTVENIRVETVSGDDIQAGIAQIKVNGEVLVDGMDTGPFAVLRQSWSEWVVTTLRTAAAEADALKVMLKSHAQTYAVGTDYCEGTVITAFGELWIAINDSPSTTFADLPALLTHPNWEKLGINA